jgi:phenylacetate-CoA ligase
MLDNFIKFLAGKSKVYAPREELNSMRTNLLRKQLLFAYRNIPYYKKTFDEANLNPQQLISPDDLSAYPIITKDILRKYYDEIVNPKYFLGNLFKSHTSGTTGQPMWTYYDMTSWIRKKYFVKARARMECGVKPYEKIAIFESQSQNSSDKANIFFRTLKSRYKAFSMFEPDDKTLGKLMTFSPAVLYGAPSYFFQLARFIAENGFQLPFIRQIFTSSEYLQETVREYIKKVFNADVFDIYGSTEFKEVAWECGKQEGYHINEDEIIIEIVQNGKRVPHGVVGNIVITDLRNKLMPLIRYQLHDKGVLITEKCSCGRTFSLMKPYAGRSSEYITLPDGGILSPYLFTTSIEKINGLLQYQIVQTTKDKILVSVVTNSENSKQVGFSIKDILSNITNKLMEIEVQFKTKLDIEENRKFKVVKNLTLEEKEIKI